MIGLLMASFMGGLAFGSFMANTKFKRQRIGSIIIFLLLSMIVFGLYLNATPKLGYRLSAFIIPMFSFFFAMLVGAVFPMAVKEYRSKYLENKAGVLYGCDLLGGAASAVITSLLFMPVFGIMGTIAIPISLCLISLILLLHSSS
jgi:predicted membrane-bound spermidine synthase